MFETSQAPEVMQWFKAISDIPRGSFNEKGMADFVEKFGQDRQLATYRDAKDNILISLPATPGYEDRPGIILQGHMDMVCEKVEGSDHNFETDPLQLQVEDGWLSAKDTSLGGDDGIAVAYMLAFLDGDYPHPYLECLFTTEEEVGMGGAIAFDTSLLKGKYLFNIDGEIENDLLVGCAGGLTFIAEKDLEWVPAQKTQAYKIKISGLTGGHSGQEIEKSRANAIKLMVRLLDQADFEMVSFQGGSKINAIPTSAEATVRMEDSQLEGLKAKAQDLTAAYQESDPQAKIEIIETEATSDQVWSKATQRAVCDSLMMVPDGVIYMDPSFPGLVQTSVSNGRVEMDDRIIRTTALLRSSKEAQLHELERRFALILGQAGFRIQTEGGYPAWEYDPQSKLRNFAKDTYQKVFNRPANVHTIHCGLECGIFKGTLGHVDMITFGPDILDVHTVNERANLESIAKMWAFLKELVVAIEE